MMDGDPGSSSWQRLSTTNTKEENKKNLICTKKNNCDNNDVTYKTITELTKKFGKIFDY